MVCGGGCFGSSSKVQPVLVLVVLRGCALCGLRESSAAEAIIESTAPPPGAISGAVW